MDSDDQPQDLSTKKPISVNIIIPPNQNANCTSKCEDSVLRNQLSVRPNALNLLVAALDVQSAPRHEAQLNRLLSARIPLQMQTPPQPQQASPMAMDVDRNDKRRLAFTCMSFI